MKFKIKINKKTGDNAGSPRPFTYVENSSFVRLVEFFANRKRGWSLVVARDQSARADDLWLWQKMSCETRPGPLSDLRSLRWSRALHLVKLISQLWGRRGLRAHNSSASHQRFHLTGRICHRCDINFQLGDGAGRLGGVDGKELCTDVCLLPLLHVLYGRWVWITNYEIKGP